MRDKIIDLLYAENVRSDCGIERLADEICAIDPVRWIPVTERLPEKNGEYLVTKTDHITYERLIDIAHYASFIHANNGFYKADDIVAWMPLPEPWRGEEDEERLNATEQG